MVKIHDFQPLFRPPTPPQPRPIAPVADIEDAGDVFVEKKRSQLYVDAKEIKKNYTPGFSIIFVWSQKFKGVARL